MSELAEVKSHSLKVSLQIFTIFQHLWYRHPMVTFGMIAKCTTIDCGCTILSRKGTIISYLALLERLFLISLHSNDCFGRNRRRKNLPARWRSRQESDRLSFRLLRTNFSLLFFVLCDFDLIYFKRILLVYTESHIRSFDLQVFVCEIDTID